ncbi:MAG TPA: ABC transporter ATP-binding protein [Nitrospirae bacterium]|nr:ABC transporter ATP-binding protein [Nitrospirota bacterium]HDZ01011.1 ABC transporter ATP-binding protein [Nitrospirota bacterium]
MVYYQETEQINQVKYILEVDGLSKDFIPPLSFRKLIGLDFRHRRQTRALEDVSFSLKKGKILGVLGPNGAGKTTLLKILATLILPDKGSVLINGWSVGIDDNKIKSLIGLVSSQERSFYWRLTGRQNLEFFALMYDLENPGNKIEELFDLFEIDYQDNRFDSYSTGMKQKFALMRGLLNDPGLLLLDEPTRSLDYTTSLNFRNFIKENLVLEKGKTVVFTSHNMDEAMHFCDIFMILHKGRLYAMGTLDELRKKINNQTASLGEIFVKLTEGESLTRSQKSEVRSQKKKRKN